MVQIGRDAASRGRPGRREERRTEILRRAADAFREHGFHAAGMREIATAAGMVPGNLYYYFRNKDDLLYFCQRQALSRLVAGARRIARSRGSGRARLAAILEAHVVCLLETTGGSAAHLEFRSLPSARRTEIAAERDAYERLVRGVVKAGQDDLSLRRAVDRRLATLALLGAANSTVTWWRPDGRKTAREVARAFADVLVGGLAT
jgi:AcrR family transcriptional regulator